MKRVARKKEKQPQSILQYLIAGGLFVVVCFLVFAIWGIFQKEEVARKAMNDRKSELMRLEERRAAFEANLNELSTVRGQEATLRQNHGMAKAGEEVIIVVSPKEDLLEPHISPWKRFWGWFGMW